MTTIKNLSKKIQERKDKFYKTERIKAEKLIKMWSKVVNEQNLINAYGKIY